MRKTCLLAAALTIGTWPVTHASTIVQLDNTSLTGAPGETLVFNSTLTNTSATDQVWLNGIGSTASSPFLNIDPSPFDTNAPLFLDPLASSGPFELFDVTIAPDTPDGGYNGSFVTILGGADAGAGTAFDDLADVNFDVSVQSPSNGEAPEPATFGLVFGAVLVFALADFLRRRRTASTASPR
jgi:hypothetical protein